jgi:hypothetical protein
LSKTAAPRPFLKRPVAIKDSHSFHRYLHTEAVFVFGDSLDHWSPSGGQAISGCPAISEQGMSNRITLRTRSESLASHILPVSGTMIGVCATLIGLVKLAEAKHGSSHVDEYAAMAAVTFLASALTSYLSIRYSNRARLSFQIERIADVIFLCGLIGITLVATLFAYEVI